MKKVIVPERMKQAEKVEFVNECIVDQNNGNRIGHETKLLLIRCLTANYHTSGKIEGIQDLSGTCNGEFCRKIRDESERKNLPAVCRMCYMQALNFRAGMVVAHSINALILSNFEFSVSELKTVPEFSKIFRFNSDGETVNTIHAVNYIRYAKAHPKQKCAYWFKNTPAVMAAVKLEGKPKNVTLIFSDPIINGIAGKPFPSVDYVFHVWDKDNIDSVLPFGNECNGKKCIDCGYKCYTGKHENGIHIYEKLRGKIDADIQTAIDEMMIRRNENK